MIYWLWLAWITSWFVSARFADRPVKGPGFRAEAPYRAVTTLGVFLLFVRVLAPDVSASSSFFLPDWTIGLAYAAAISGFTFAWWARIQLGRLWSGRVVKKAEHRVVTTGPYGIVRHPIYTGILSALLATALLQRTWIALGGGAVLIAGFFMKARLEERFLSDELGKPFDDYRRRVPMLVPFTKLSR